MLFADLKGSMELLADRDPEEARKILDPVLEHMMEAVHRYEGTVNQVMGDGIMALFGAPLAHEDHAVRACYAALRMQESREALRGGGPALHGSRSRSASGSTPARWSCGPSAPICTWTTRPWARRPTWPRGWSRSRRPARSCITPTRWRLAEGYVEVEAAGPVPGEGPRRRRRGLRGHGSRPARTRLQAAAARGLTRFVGRDAEVEHLRRVARPGRRRPRAGGRHRGRGRSGQVAADLRVHPLASRPGLADPGGVVGLLWQGHQLPARDRPAEGLLQDRRPGRSPGDARQGAGARAGPGPRARASAAPAAGATRRAGRGRRPGRSSPRRSAASARWTRSSGCCCGRARCNRCWWSSRTCTGSMARPRPCSTASWRASVRAPAAPGELPPRVRAPLGEQDGVLPAPARHPARRERGGAAGGAARAGSRAGPAHADAGEAGQPVLPGGDGANAGGDGGTGWGAGSVPADAAGGDVRGAGDGADDPGGADRPAPRGRQAVAPDGLGHRQGRALRAAPRCGGGAGGRRASEAHASAGGRVPVRDAPLSGSRIHLQARA